mmetsp:Transcript_10070/g.31553  ORF Transcript_10070/g.31553 Transcript_10070/m.31553 type:complete len:221 (-) Transcript_10070:23-685(-)
MPCTPSVPAGRRWRPASRRPSRSPACCNPPSAAGIRSSPRRCRSSPKAPACPALPRWRPWWTVRDDAGAARRPRGWAATPTCTEATRRAPTSLSAPTPHSGARAGLARRRCPRRRGRGARHAPKARKEAAARKKRTGGASGDLSLALSPQQQKKSPRRAIRLRMRPRIRPRTRRCCLLSHLSPRFSCLSPRRLSQQRSPPPQRRPTWARPDCQQRLFKHI